MTLTTKSQLSVMTPSRSSCVGDVARCRRLRDRPRRSSPRASGPGRSNCMLEDEEQRSDAEPTTMHQREAMNRPLTETTTGWPRRLGRGCRSAGRRSARALRRAAPAAAEVWLPPVARARALSLSFAVRRVARWPSDMSVDRPVRDSTAMHLAWNIGEREVRLTSRCRLSAVVPPQDQARRWCRRSRTNSTAPCRSSRCLALCGTRSIAVSTDGIVEIERRRRDVVANRQDREDRLDRAGRAEQMADRRLGRGHARLRRRHCRPAARPRRVRSRRPSASRCRAR